MCALCVLTGCHRLDRQFESTNYGRFGAAVHTECKFAAAIDDARCREVAVCVNLHMLDHDRTRPSSFAFAYDEFTEALVEFVFGEDAVRDETGRLPEFGDSGAGEVPRSFRFRIGADGSIRRWSAVAQDWLPDGRNIRSESIPRRVSQLIESAASRGDVAAVRLFEVFVAARAECFPEGQSRLGGQGQAAQDQPGGCTRCTRSQLLPNFQLGMRPAKLCLACPGRGRASGRGSDGTRER